MLRNDLNEIVNDPGDASDVHQNSEQSIYRLHIKTSGKFPFVSVDLRDVKALLETVLNRENEVDGRTNPRLALAIDTGPHRRPISVLDRLVMENFTVRESESNFFGDHSREFDGDL